MGVINFIILSFLSAVFILTLNKINCDFGARNFLENITYLPNEPVTSTVLIFIAFFLLLGIIEIRRKQRKRQQVSVILYAAEILLCLIIIKFVYVNYNGISIDTVINGSSSVGIVWADKELIQISEKKSYIRKGYRKLIGHYDYLRICINNLEGEKFPVDKGSTLFFINFMTERFCELLMSDNTEGLRSSPVEVEVYLNGNLKPYSVKQARSHGLEVVLKPEGYKDIPKFYELDFVDYATNVLDENGNDRPNPLVESVDMESIGYDL
jgi:hypothetical protein